MDTTSRRMIAVAVTVCGFAVGMAGLLNYFKYRSTASRVVTERLIVTGKAVENSIQSAIGLGLQFSEISTLQGTLERERATDPLIVGIDVFDTQGNPLYSTDSLRASKRAPTTWLKAAQKAGNGSWNAEDGYDAATGMYLKDNFEQNIGILAIRYSGDQVRAAAYAVGKELAFNSLLTFLVSAVVASVAVVRITTRLARDMNAVEAALAAAARRDQAGANAAAAEVAGSISGDLGASLRRFLRNTAVTERRIASVRASLHSGAAQ